MEDCFRPNGLRRYRQTNLKKENAKFLKKHRVLTYLPLWGAAARRFGAHTHFDVRLIACTGRGSFFEGWRKNKDKQSVEPIELIKPV